VRRKVQPNTSAHTCHSRTSQVPTAPRYSFADPVTGVAGTAVAGIVIVASALPPRYIEVPCYDEAISGASVEAGYGVRFWMPVLKRVRDQDGVYRAVSIEAKWGSHSRGTWWRGRRGCHRKHGDEVAKVHEHNYGHDGRIHPHPRLAPARPGISALHRNNGDCGLTREVVDDGGDLIDAGQGRLGGEGLLIGTQ